MATPTDWLANPRPAEALTSYAGDPTATWEAGPGGAKGYQAQGPNNPSGDIAGVPVMTITAAMAATLEGPQP